MAIVTGEVVQEFDPYWRVVKQPGTARNAHVVVDISVDPPQQVHGPTTKTDAVTWCQNTVALWNAAHNQGEWT